MHGAKKQFGRSMERMHKEIWPWDQPEQEKGRMLEEVNIINPDGYEPVKKPMTFGHLMPVASSMQVHAKGSLRKAHLKELCRTISLRRFVP